ncbi:hypothetical protein [uncultured Tenacibaculum sp.]|uniref:hypothetical protein n=1 Tax=uncultured Tenacibaculum sp. TaxID=174713 RepID=UPI00262B9DD9|nr:hypothetical protein [uncultured Tenacibaculum sp.]
MKKNNWLLLVIVLNLVLTFSSSHLLDLNRLTFDFYSSFLEENQVEDFINTQKKWEWLGYVIMPFVILLRSSLVAVCLSVGLFFYDIQNKIKFKDFFKVAILGEFVILSVGIVKLLYFLYIKVDYTLQDVQQYYPLSYINFLDVSKMEPWLIYPLQTINLFEIAYFFVLVYGVHKLLKNNFWKSFEITAASYGSGLTIWLGLVMFLVLNLT